MKATAVLYCLAFVTAAGLASAADYYVDSETGDNAAAGTSEQSAWRTLDGVNRADLNPGDRVLFKRGGLWRGVLNLQSGDESAKIVYASYGQGAKPRIYGSVALNNTSVWIDEGDGLWATKPTEVLPAATSETTPFLTGGWSVHTESGAEVVRSIQGTGTGAAIRLECKKPGEAAHHIQLINASFPIIEGESYRLTFRATSTVPFNLTQPRLSMSGSPWSGYGPTSFARTEVGTEPTECSVVFSANQTAQDGRVMFALGSSLPAGAVVALDRFAVERVKIFDAGLRRDVGNVILDGKMAGWKRWTKADLKNANDFWFDIMGDQRLWFKSEKNPAQLFESIEAANMLYIINHSEAHDVTVEGLDIRYGAAHGFGGTKAKRLTIRDCDLSWIGGGDQYAQGGQGRRVRYGNAIEFWADASDCLVENCRIWEVYDAALTNQGAGTNVEENITYRGNLIWNCEYSFEYWNRDEMSRTENILFENNICYNAGYGWGHVQRPDKNGRHFMVYQNTAKTKNFVVRNNVFCDATESLIRLDRAATNPDWPNQGLTLDQNRYFDSENRDCALWLGEQFAFERFDDFRRASGMEKSGVWQKPNETLDALVPENKPNNK